MREQQLQEMRAIIATHKRWDMMFGVLGIIASALAEENVNIESGSVRSLMDNKAELDFVVEVKDTVHLYHVIDKLRALEDVEEISRSHAGPER